MGVDMLVWVFLLATFAFAHAQAQCGGTFEGGCGIISSPGYPRNYYPEYSSCQWDIIAPPQGSVFLSFIEFRLEDCECCDYVEIYEMELGEKSKSYGKFCRTKLPPAISSKGNHLRIVFASDGGRAQKGFRAAYQVTSNAEEDPEVAPEKPVKSKNVHWLLNQIKERYLKLPRTILALFLAEPELFETGNRTFAELRDELKIHILVHLSRNETIRGYELAHYIQALMVTCQDPRYFNGHDLLSELRSRVDHSSTFPNPFEVLALCNAGADVSSKDVQKVLAAFDTQLRPFSTDVQAIATMAMKCLSSKVTVDERVIKDMQDELKKKQFRNGTVENIVTTALVVQALGHKNGSDEFFDLPSALEVLTSSQDEDGSWGRSVRNSFYLLPAISNRSFLDINDRHCPKKNEMDDKFLVKYSVWTGEDGNLLQSWKWWERSNKTMTFYDVIEMVSMLDNRHNVSYQVVDGKPYLRSLFGEENDPESGIFWFTYVRSTSSNAPPTLIERSPADVNVIPNQELILWYKSNDWSASTTEEASTHEY